MSSVRLCSYESVIQKLVNLFTIYKSRISFLHPIHGRSIIIFVQARILQVLCKIKWSTFNVTK